MKWNLRSTLTPEQRIVVLKCIIGMMVVDELMMGRTIVQLKKERQQMKEDMRFMNRVVKCFVRECEEHGQGSILHNVNKEAEFQYVIKGLED